MALTLRTNGSSGANLITASWWNDYYNLFTGAMADQPITLIPDITMKAIGVAPGSFSLALAAGTNLGTGVYYYAVTFVDGSGGESLPSALQTITTTTGNQAVNLTGIPTGPTGTTDRHVYRTKVGLTQLLFVGSLGNNSTGSYSDTKADTALGASAPQHATFGGSFILRDSASHVLHAIANDGAVLGNNVIQGLYSYNPTAPTLTLAAGTNLGIGVYKYVVTFVSTNGETVGGSVATTTTTSGNQQVNLSNITIGPSRTLYRNIYRTTVGGSVYKFLTQIADNTTTTYNDSTVDGSLGATIAPVHSTFSGSLKIIDQNGVNQFTMSQDGYALNPYRWAAFLNGSTQRVLDINPPDGTKNYALDYFSTNTLGFHNYTDAVDMLLLDNLGNTTVGGTLTIGGGAGAVFTWGSGVLSITPPWAGAANGTVFDSWNGSAHVNVFSIGGQFNSCLAWVDNSGVFNGLFKTVRNGTATGSTIFTGTTTPTANAVGDIWVNA